MIGDRMVYFFNYKQYLKLYDHALGCISAFCVFLNYEQNAKDPVQ